MKFNHITQALLAILLFIAALSTYGLWYGSVSKKSAEASRLATEIQTKRQDSERVKAAKNELQKISAQENLVKGYYVATNDVVPFLELLQSTGKSLGSTVEVVSVSADPGKPHSHLNLSLSITGPFDSVVRTLGALEYAPYYTALQSLALDTPQTGGGKAAQWTAAATFLVGTADASNVQNAAAPSTRAAGSTTTTSP